MNIFLVMRQPYIEKVESLMCLINYLATSNIHVHIITTVDEQYLMPFFASKNIECSLIDTLRSKSPFSYVPSSARILIKVIKSAMSEKPALIIGADQLGTIIGQLAAQVLGIPFVYYSLEYPVERAALTRRVDKLEYRAIKKSRLAITFDDAHAKFISREVGTDKNKFLFLPNSSGPRTKTGKTSVLQKLLNLPDNEIIVLHSGGFGQWFYSLELSREALSWPDNCRLVFNTSHFVEHTDYAKQFSREIQGTKVILNSSPVPFSELDDLIRSADIGIAIYNIDLLGFRGDLVGLASGKVGRYLKNGLPIIVQRLSSFVPFVEQYECGVCVNDLSEINGAISRIMSNYQFYSENALRCYDELWDPEPYCRNLAQHILENFS